MKGCTKALKLMKQITVVQLNYLLWDFKTQDQSSSLLTVIYDLYEKKRYIFLKVLST